MRHYIVPSIKFVILTEIWVHRKCIFWSFFPVRYVFTSKITRVTEFADTRDNDLLFEIVPPIPSYKSTHSPRIHRVSSTHSMCVMHAPTSVGGLQAAVRGGPPDRGVRPAGALPLPDLPLGPVLRPRPREIRAAGEGFVPGLSPNNLFATYLIFFLIFLQMDSCQSHQPSFCFIVRKSPFGDPPPSMENQIEWSPIGRGSMAAILNTVTAGGGLCWGSATRLFSGACRQLPGDGDRGAVPVRQDVPREALHRLRGLQRGGPRRPLARSSDFDMRPTPLSSCLSGRTP